MVPLLWRNPGSTIHDAYASIGVCADRHFASRSGVGNGILDQIPDRVADRVAVPFDDHRFVFAVEGDRFLFSKRPGRHRRHDFGGDIIEINSIRDVQSDRIQTSNAHKLIDEPVHARDISFDLGYLTILLNDIEGGRDNGKRCAQLMGCIRGELTLKVEALLKAVQCAIDRGDQGRDLTW